MSWLRSIRFKKPPKNIMVDHWYEDDACSFEIPPSMAEYWDMDKVHEKYVEKRKAYPQKWFDENWILEFGFQDEPNFDDVWDEDEEESAYSWKRQFSCSIHQYLPKQFILRDSTSKSYSLLWQDPDDTLKDWPISILEDEKVIRVDLKRTARLVEGSIFPPFVMQGLTVEWFDPSIEGKL